MMPILNAWKADEGKLYQYPAGAAAFPHADQIITADERKWRQLSQM
jgi:glucose-6-phosphate 1-dehydrogenase